MHFPIPQKSELLHKLRYKLDVKPKGHTVTACVYITILTQLSFEHVASSIHQPPAFFTFLYEAYWKKLVLLQVIPRYLPSCVRYIYSP